MEGLKNHLEKHKNGTSRPINKNTGTYKGIKSKNGRFICNKCGKKFRYPKWLLTHEETCQLEGIEAILSENFKFNEDVSKKRDTILDTAKTSCKKCGREYAQSRGKWLRAHELKCTGDGLGLGLETTKCTANVKHDNDL